METTDCGLYIHIPFCTGKCAYCDFYSLPNCASEVREKYLKRLSVELRAFSHVRKKIDTVYLGGGTPGILSKKELSTLLNVIYSDFSVAKNTEITVEVNPNVHLDFCDYRDMGVNRISMGVQTLSEKGLKAAGRRHTATEALTALESAKSVISEVSADFIIGLPETNPGDVAESVRKTADFLTHASAYVLKPEPNTPLGKAFLSGAKKEWTEDEYADGYDLAVAELKRCGFMRYEISNFAKGNSQSRHNLKYWLGKEYMGAGAAAHSFLNGVRMENPSSIEAYVTNPTVGEGGGKRQEIFLTERLYERIILGLRLERGVNVKELEREFRIDFQNKYAKALKEIAPIIEWQGERLKMKSENMLLESFAAVAFLDN